MKVRSLSIEYKDCFYSGVLILEDSDREAHISLTSQECEKFIEQNKYSFVDVGAQVKIDWDESPSLVPTPKVDPNGQSS